MESIHDVRRGALLGIAHLHSIQIATWLPHRNWDSMIGSTLRTTEQCLMRTTSNDHAVVQAKECGILLNRVQLNVLVRHGPILKRSTGKRAMTATLHLEEEWENHPTHKAPQSGQWTMRKPSRRHGLDMRNLLSALAMWTPHPPTALTTIHDHGGTIHTTLGANDVRALRNLGQLHRSAITQTQPLKISTVAQLLRRPFHPAIGGPLEIRERSWVHVKIHETTVKRDDAKKEEDLANSAID